MIVVMAANTDYPRTDKGNIIRAQVYRTFTNIIQETYEGLRKETRHRIVVVDMNDIKVFLRDEINSLGIQVDNDNADLFTTGLDSLKAIQLASSITRHFSFNQYIAKVDQNIVYDQGSIHRLALYIHSLQSGLAIDDEQDELDAMSALVDKYSHFTSHNPNGTAPGCKTAV